MQTYSFAHDQVPVLGTWDTVVVGGGTAGCSAGASAAARGNRTLMVERFASLGGTPVHALVTPMMDSRCPHGEMLASIERRLQALGVPTRETPDRMGYLWFDPADMEEALDGLLADAGCEVLLGATLVAAHVQDGRLRAIEVMTDEGPFALLASQFVDATGDALLSRLAGVTCVSGDDAGNDQLCSLRFEMGGVDVDAYRAYCLSLGDEFSPLVDGFFWESAMVAGRGFKLEPLFQRAVQDGVLHADDLVYYQCFSLPGRPDALGFNCPHIPDTRRNTSARARSRALAQGRERTRRLVRFLTGYMPGFQHAYLAHHADMLGVRESWRIQGTYVLDEEDYARRARFDDAVARGTWYIDVHSAKDGLVHMEKYRPGEYYHIPYRCLTNRQVPNLLTVGRCISTTFLVQASVRIQQTAVDMGESAGRACAAALAADVELADFHGRGLLTPPE